jgi:DNA repair protein RecN (Recombination protein N)
MLDEFGGLSADREQLREKFHRLQRQNAEADETAREIAEVEQGQELARFQIGEIEQAQLSPNEDAVLTEKKNRLQHAEELMGIVLESYQDLYEKDDSVLSSISGCVKRLERGATLDSQLAPIRDALHEISLKVEDLSYTLRDLHREIPLEPHVLEEVSERLELINRLKRKYGPSLEDVLAYKEKASAGLVDVEERRNQLALLHQRSEELGKHIVALARELSEKRKGAARTLQEAVERELTQVQMGDTLFRVDFGERSEERKRASREELENVREDGLDQVEFVISPNVGEQPRPLARIASGGELSRIMLALKTILAKTASVETLVFDEVDAGIGGATADVLGEKLRSLTQFHQILCITHLPQIARQGQTHFLVSKRVVEDRTQTFISELDPEGRVQEIARLLGGREITKRAVDHAREMIG